MNGASESSIEERFIGFVADPAFPCVGAKAAQAHKTIAFYRAYSIEASSHDARAARALQDFAKRLAPGDLYCSFVMLFPHAKSMGEAEFERHLWRRLQGMHAHDHMGYAWDPAVSSDPESPEFSMSIGGKAFYVIGLHPDASRLARRFECPALVFNAHEQFEQLRASGLYDKMKTTIIERDIAANGSSNPMLAVHGERSEARQYSGRVVGENWQCPFHAQHNEDQRARHH